MLTDGVDADCTTEPHGNCTDYPSKLFNHMVQPFVGFGLRAIIWYQVTGPPNRLTLPCLLCMPAPMPIANLCEWTALCTALLRMQLWHRMGMHATALHCTAPY